MGSCDSTNLDGLFFRKFGPSRIGLRFHVPNRTLRKWTGGLAILFVLSFLDIGGKINQLLALPCNFPTLALPFLCSSRLRQCVRANLCESTNIYIHACMLLLLRINSLILQFGLLIHSLTSSMYFCCREMFKHRLNALVVLCFFFFHMRISFTKMSGVAQSSSARLKYVEGGEIAPISASDGTSFLLMLLFSLE